MSLCHGVQLLVCDNHRPVAIDGKSYQGSVACVDSHSLANCCTSGESIGEVPQLRAPSNGGKEGSGGEVKDPAKSAMLVSATITLSTAPADRARKTSPWSGRKALRRKPK